MNSQLQSYLNLFIAAQDPNLSVRTLYNKEHQALLFLRYLDSRNIHTLAEFDVNVVYEFIASLEYSSQTISGFQFNIREFFDVMHDNNVTSLSGRTVFPVIFTNKRDRILSYYETNEVRSLINCIDISAKNGVRDKCMVLLAAQTGLRARDILHLRFDEIFWDKDLICKIQQKTKLPVSVPLPNNLKILLIDYIRNYRPTSDEKYVFIREESGTAYSASFLYVVINHYFRKANISIGNRKHGPHAMRHSLASNLLRENAPMPVITGILGHKDLNTTSKYLSIDVESLRDCCLEVPHES